jgi:hypothetical protein
MFCSDLWGALQDTGAEAGGIRAEAGTDSHIPERDDRGRSAKGVKKFVSQFTTMAHCGRDPTPMLWIYQTRSYGYPTPAAGKIQWIQDEVLYPGTRVQMSQLRSMVHGLIGEARDELFGKLMVVTNEGAVPSIDWDNTVDQPSETGVGWSFLDDERKKFGAHREWWLYERMYQERAGAVFGRRRVVEARPGAGEAYQRHVERFLELLLVLVVEEHGQRGRAKQYHGEWVDWFGGPVP